VAHPALGDEQIMTKDRLSDAEAKRILCKWPSRTRRLWKPPGGKGFWLAALPKVGNTTCPTIKSPGAEAFKTQPDGLWVYISPENSIFADVVSIEVCGTAQNVNDKRSRYMPASHSLLLSCPLKWLLEETKVPNRGKKPRWEAALTFGKEPKEDLSLPIRNLRVLYALPTKIYVTWRKNHTPAGYEFYCKHSSLDSYNSQTMQEFLHRMALEAHYRTLK
jgi:hypothetical protein